MARTKWEDLEKDYLLNVLTRVGTESMLYDIPFVCKSWYRASLDPLCWKIINFQNFVRQTPLASEYSRSLINRNGGNATTVMLPMSCEYLKSIINCVEEMLLWSCPLSPAQLRC